MSSSHNECAADGLEASLSGQQITSELVQSRHVLTTEKILGGMERLVRSVGADLEERFDEHYTREILPPDSGVCRADIEACKSTYQQAPIRAGKRKATDGFRRGRSPSPSGDWAGKQFVFALTTGGQPVPRRVASHYRGEFTVELARAAALPPVTHLPNNPIIPPINTLKRHPPTSQPVTQPPDAILVPGLLRPPPFLPQE